MIDTPFRLAEWAIEPALGMATCDGREVRLEPKVMAVLLCLVSRAGQVVSKDELLSEVWPDTHVQEVALSRGISELRRQLGDDARAPRLIETLPKRGYRLIARIEPIEPIESVRTPEPPAGSSIRSGRRWLMWLTLALAAIGLTWLAAPKPEAESIVVLPFENYSGDAELDYFSDGMTEEIITRLSAIDGLSVVSRTTAMRYKGTDLGLSDIARRLRVARVLEGSVRLQDGRVRISANLIDGVSDRHLWSQTFDRQLADVFELQEEVARHIATKLGETLVIKPPADGPPRPTDSLTAYDLYLRGREQYNRQSRAGNEAAIELYLQALKLDSDYAEARAELASAYGLRVANYDFDVAWAQHGEQEARRVLAQSPDLPEAHKALGLALSQLGRPRQAVTAYRKALELRPGYEEAMHNAAYLVHQLGEWDEAGRWQPRPSARRQQLR